MSCCYKTTTILQWQRLPGRLLQQLLLLLLLLQQQRQLSRLLLMVSHMQTIAHMYMLRLWQSYFLHVNQVGETPLTRAYRPPTPGILPEWVNRLFLVILWPVEVVSEKSLKLLPPDVIFKAKMHQIRFWMGQRPDPLRAFTALLRPLAGYKGPTSKGKEVNFMLSACDVLLL